MFSGVLTKMITEFGDQINYYINLENDFIIVNQFLNKKLKLNFNGYQCLNCKSNEIIFRRGFCKKCFYRLPSTGDWIMRPELSTAHLNVKDRDLEYEKKIQIQPHIIYLALSSHLKVGVTRKSQILTRWIDQGAHQAIAIAETPNRYLAGIGEVAIKEFYSDKTNWRKMLENNFESINWNIERVKAIEKLPDELNPYILRDNIEPITINFPLIKVPDKVKSLNIVKNIEFEGILKGIKGQYLIFDDNIVFNIRSNEGLLVSFN